MIGLRTLPFETLDGPTHFAADDVLLEIAATGIAALRLGTIAPPILTIGYSQPLAAAGGRWPVLRRPGAGGLLEYGDDLLLSLAMPVTFVPPEPWGCLLIHAITDQLQARGIACESVICDEETRSPNGVCEVAAGDILVQARDGRRHAIGGTHQRRQRAAILQTAHLKLAGTAASPGLLELTGLRIEPIDLADDLTTALCRALNADSRNVPWSDTERSEIARIARDKYTSPEWTARR